ncbi:MAG: SRPBCC family protein [Spirochaetota bacterium]|nr:SRPBCC family protein [Spirochaetota bacterium]
MILLNRLCLLTSLLCFVALDISLYAESKEMKLSQHKNEDKATASETTIKPDTKIIIEDLKNDEGIKGIRSTFLVKARLKDVWKWIRDVDYLPELFPAVKKVTLVQQVSANTIIWEYQFESAMGKKVLNVKRSIDDDNYQVKWKRTKGDMKYYAGGWNIKSSQKYSGWVEVQYSNFINAGTFIPYFLVKRNSKKNAEVMVHRLREFVGEGVPLQ